MELIPIKQKLEDNGEFICHPLCQESIHMAVDFYKKVGFVNPWIGYYAKVNGDFVGSGAFKGPPVNEKVEIAYGTFENYRKQGMATAICKNLVAISQNTDPSIKVTARTLPEKSFSTKVLEHNNFIYLGTVLDPDDGEVWEWEYQV